MASVHDEIKSEREYQLTKFGTDFDDKNTPHQWFGYIAAYGARHLAGMGPVDLAAFRVDMVKVATLAAAAVEAIDRKAASAA
jgi:hypothetical protein